MPPLAKKTKQQKYLFMPRTYGLEFKLEDLRMGSELRVTARVVEKRRGIGQGRCQQEGRQAPVEKNKSGLKIVNLLAITYIVLYFPI